jgi:hypothetical protein
MNDVGVSTIQVFSLGQTTDISMSNETLLSVGWMSSTSNSGVQWMHKTPAKSYFAYK